MNLKFFVYLIINIVILCELVFVGYSNINTILANNSSLKIQDLCYAIIPFIIFSFMVGVYFCIAISNKKEKKFKEYQRELERRGIDRDESSSRVKILESKIEVLEKALQDAIQK